MFKPNLNSFLYANLKSFFLNRRNSFESSSDVEKEQFEGWNCHSNITNKGEGKLLHDGFKFTRYLFESTFVYSINLWK